MIADSAPGPAVVDTDVRRFWEANADAWTVLARQGYDVYRDFLNTPAFFAMLPDVRRLRGLDLGCGEGYNTRLLARRGACVTAVDISTRFLAYASGLDPAITLCAATASGLPFPARAFDFAAAFMSLMDMADLDRVVAEVYRVIKPGGFFQFSISHPCFDTPHRRNLRDAAGQTYAIEVGDYYRATSGQVDEWLFSAAPASAKAGLPKFRIPRFTRTLSVWTNTLIDAGFVLERLEEPRPSDETVRLCPVIQDAQVVSYFLHVRVRRPR